MTAVMLLGDIPSTGVLGRLAEAPRVSTDEDDSPDWMTDFLARTSRALARRDAVLVLYPSWEPAAAARAVRLARTVMRTDRVAGLDLALPPLALSIVADQLSFLATHVSPGTLASAGRKLAGTIVAGAWLRSVTRLEHVKTGFTQHLSSYLPGVSFMVTVAPRPGIHRITATAPVASTGRLTAPVHLVAAQEDGDDGWLATGLKPGLGAATLTDVECQPLSRRFWRTGRYVEFAAFSGHPKALRDAVKALPLHRCRWCGEATAQARCAFCAMTQQHNGREGAA